MEDGLAWPFVIRYPTPDTRTEVRAPNHFSGQFPIAQFAHEFLRMVNLVEPFENRGGIHGSCAGLFVLVSVIQWKALQIAVENNSHEFTGAIHHWAAGIAADDVRRAYEIIGRL